MHLPLLGLIYDAGLYGTYQRSYGRYTLLRRTTSYENAGKNFPGTFLGASIGPRTGNSFVLSFEIQTFSVV